jgi:cytosol alanyl aminopeptidase
MDCLFDSMLNELNLPIESNPMRHSSLVLWLSAAATLLATQLSATESDNEFVLKKVAKPSFQSIEMTLDPAKDSYTGSTIITLDITKPTQTIEISGRDYSIGKSVLSHDKQARTQPGKLACDLKPTMLKIGKVALDCDKTVKKGRYTLSIEYSAPYNRQSVGLYKTIDGGAPYLFTQFEMSDARRAIPSFDEPAYKIPFQMTITSPKGLKVYNNTPLVNSTEVKGMVKHEFAPTKPISSYLIALAVGDFEEIEVKGMSVPGKVITTKGKIHLATYAAKQMPRVLGALEDYFGSQYPYTKLDSVAVPEFPFGAMENAGLVTYREDILLLDEDKATQNSRHRNVSIIAHELAHQWYGNLVTMQWWNDLWLNEAFASWMAAKITQQLNPEFDSHLRLSKNRAMVVDAKTFTKPIRKPIKTEADIMDGLGLAYSKGEAVLSMVENWIGADNFQAGLRQYMKKHAFKNAVADDLWSALGKASGQDVASVLKTFIVQSSFPLLKVQIDGNKLLASQSRFLIAGTSAPEQSWSFPITVKYGKDDKVASKIFLMTKESQSFKLDFEPEWFYPDENAMGYYRFVLSGHDLENLLTKGKKHLNDRERKALIASVDALLDAGVVSAADLLKTIGQFLGDPHPTIVKTALDYIQAQKSVFIDQSNERSWAKYITASTNQAIQTYGLTSKKDEPTTISKLRPSLIRLIAFEAKSEAVIKTAKQQSQLYLEGLDDVDPYMVSTYLQIAAFYGDADFIKGLKLQFEQTKDPTKRTRLLNAMGFARDAEMQNDILAYSLTDTINAPDMSTLLDGQSFTKPRAKRFYQWIFNNYDQLASKLPPFQVAYLPYFTADKCDLGQLETTEAFFKTKLESVPEFKRSLKKLRLSIEDCVRLKDRESESVNAFLKQF